MTAYLYKRFGWTVYGDGRKGGQVLEMGYKDAALELGTEPIPPSHQLIIRTFLNGEVTFLGALWADGTSCGAPEWVTRLLEHRALAQRHNDNEIAVLQTALDSGTDKPALIKQLQSSMDGITETTVNADDVGALHSHYQQVIRMLANPDSVLKRPDGTPAHMTEREIILLSLEELEARRARFQQYR